MRFLATATISAAALTLAACGSENSREFTTEDGETAEYTIDNDSGETSMTVNTSDGTVSMRSGADVPIDLPAGFGLIGGANVTSNTIVDQGGTKGAIVTFETDQSPDEIFDFYRAQAEAAGVTIQIETKINDGGMIGGENEATGLTFSVTAYRGANGTTGQLTIGEDPG
ncbi:MAG: hypothetical protein AAF697_09600 [Pseudomonadota bacterium]